MRSPPSTPTTGPALRAVIAAFVAADRGRARALPLRLRPGRALGPGRPGGRHRAPRSPRPWRRVMAARLAEAGRPTGAARDLGLRRRRHGPAGRALVVDGPHGARAPSWSSSSPRSPTAAWPPCCRRGAADERARGPGGLRGRGHRRPWTARRRARRGPPWPPASTRSPGTWSGPAGWPPPLAPRTSFEVTHAARHGARRGHRDRRVGQHPADRRRPAAVPGRAAGRRETP